MRSLESDNPFLFPTASMTNGSPRHNQSPMAARSNSAIDPSAVRRANVRAQYAQRSRMGVTVGASLRNNNHFYTLLKKLNTKLLILKNSYFPARPGRKNSGTPLTTPDSARSGRSRSRIGSASGVGASGALSQPGSRSTSPSSIKSYHTYFEAAGPNGSQVESMQRGWCINRIEPATH